MRVRSLKLSDGFDAAIIPREAVIFEGMGFHIKCREARRIGDHLAPFGAVRTKGGDYRIPCESRGKLPSTRFEFSIGRNAARRSVVLVDFNELILNEVCLH